MARVEKAEIATLASDPYVAAFQTILQPTDETLLTQGRGKGLAVYDEIRRDPHAFSVLQKRALEVVSREWHVYEASPARRDKKAADLVKTQLGAINFDRLTRGLLGAVLKGFAVAEVIWTNIGGVWTVTAVKVKKQRRFKFTIDGELRLLTRDSLVDGVAVPPRKFIVHRHSIDDDDDDPYGIGLGSVLFWPAWFKRQALAIWLRASERFASPTVDASYTGSFDEGRQSEVLDALNRMATDAGIVHPENVTLKLLEAARGGGGDILQNLNRYLDEMVSEAVLGETLSTNAGDVGTQALGTVQERVRLAIAKADADLVCSTLKETLVRWIVELNYPGAGIPDVWRDFDEPEDLDKKAERDNIIVGMGYRPKDVSYIDDTYGGEWVDTKTRPEAEPQPKRPSSANDAVDQLFADAPEPAEKDDVEDLADQLQTLAEKPVDAMIEAIRKEVDDAVSYDDLAMRLLRLSSEIGIDDLAGLMEQAAVVADLKGRESVVEEGGK